MPYSGGVKLQDEISTKIINTVTKMVYEGGAANINVQMVLKKLKITNRVFYNRFKNIDEVLLCVSQNLVHKMRQCMLRPYNEKENYHKYLVSLATDVLVKTYEIKKDFSDYMFNNDIVNESNKLWWIDHMIPALEYGVKNGFLKPMDIREMAYAVWCFCRCFNVDAIKSRLELNKALETFTMAFTFLIDGMTLNKDTRK